MTTVYSPAFGLAARVRPSHWRHVRSTVSSVSAGREASSLEPVVKERRWTRPPAAAMATTPAWTSTRSW